MSATTSPTKPRPATRPRIVEGDEEPDVASFEDAAADRDTADEGLPFDPDAFDCELDELDLSDCEVPRRGGGVSTPFVGCTAWFLPEVPMGLQGAGLRFSGGAETEDATLMADGFEDLAAALSEILVGYDIRRSSGEPYPQPYRNPEALRAIPTPLFLGLLQFATQGEASWGKGDASSDSGGTYSTGTRLHRPKTAARKPSRLGRRQGRNSQW